MYYRGILTVDPKELTKIQIEKPKGVFKQILYNITGGKVGEEKEVETFTAIAIVQQIYNCFTSLGVDNIIRLNHDDIEIYYDDKGEKNDFQFAVDKYSIEIDESMSAYFNTLWIVLEYEDNDFKYLIEFSINRNHCISKYPIEIIISGLLKETAEGVKSKADLKNKMNATFNSQQAYNNFISTKQIDFNNFLSKINFELRRQIRVDDIKQSVKTRQLIQKGENRKVKGKKPEYGAAPYDYYGFDDFLFSAILWSDLCFDFGLNIASTELIDEAGTHLLDINESGISAVEGSIFDAGVDINSAIGTGGIIENMDTSGLADAASSITDSGGSWFGSVLENIDFDF